MKLGMQHIHLELLYNLGYTFSKKIKNISRINISDNYKIVIKSPEVHFCNERHHVEDGQKNLNSFSYKNHLDRFCIIRNQFLIKDLQNNFVEIFGTEASHGMTHNISKIQLQRTFRICDTTRSKFFSFLFFHAKTIKKKYGYALEKL
jgi:hypothetical protein